MDDDQPVASQETFLVDSSSVEMNKNGCCDYSKSSSHCLRQGLRLLNKILTKIWNFYIFLNTNALTAIVLILLIIGTNIALFFVAVLTHPVEVDYSLNAFEVHDHKVAEPLDSLMAAKLDVIKSHQEENAKKKHRTGRSTNPELVLRSQYQRKWKLDIIYEAKDGNVFTEDKLEFIHRIEKNLMQHPKFQDFCWKTNDALHDDVLQRQFHGCMPPNSLIDFFYRTDRFDGQGRELSDIPETLDYLLTKISTFWYVDGEFSAENRRSKMLRSQLHFGIPLKGYTDSKESVEQQHEIFKDFLMKYVKQLGKASSNQITVLYGSPEIYDYEVINTFRHDVLLATVSFGLIVVLVFVLSSFSFWLTITGVLTIILSLPFAYFCYRVLLGIKSIGILTGTTAFVIIGIGVDDVFVFINIFKQATHLKDPRQQMKHCILTAGKATFFTSFTTAAAFGANILSEVPAVHDFGLFTCILVMICWLMVLLLMPPSLYLWKKWLVKCETCLCVAKCRKRWHTDTSGDNLLDNEELENDLHSGEFFEMMGQETGKEADASTQNILIPKCCTITRLLSAFLEKFIAKPFTKGKYIVLAVYLMITAGSIVAITHLKTASGSPQLFAKDSNMQRLLDLKSNLSTETIDCSSCSEVLAEVYPGTASHAYNLNGYRGILPLFKRSINEKEWHNNGTKSEDRQYGLLGANTTIPSDGMNLPHTTQRARPHSATFVANTTNSTGQTGQNFTIASATISTIDNHGLGKSNITSGTAEKVNNTVMTSLNSTTELGIKSVARKTTQLAVSTVASTQARGDRKFTADSSTVLSTANSRDIALTTQKRVAKKTKETVTGIARTTSDIVTTRTTARPTKPPLCPKPCTPVKRPSLDINALVFVVFGIKGIDRSTANGKHVLGDGGTPIYDDKFRMSGRQLSVVASGSFVKALCKICYKFQSNTDLVLPGGADCFPREIYRRLKLFRYSECQNLTEPNYANGRISLSMIGVIRDEIKWMAMTFESTVYTGKSAFLIAEDYKRWQDFTKSVLNDPEVPEALKGGFQTSNSWVNMFSEIIAVNGSIYGTTLSLVMCLAAVIIFTGNFMLSFIVFLTIAGALASVIGIFYFAGWQLGAVEAISLSILVGTSVDYTAHLTEGYVMAAKIADFDSMTNKEIRFQRVRLALSHIGVSIFSSAITTIIAAIPLCLTSIRLFSKFGEILAINTGMSILYTLTICVSLLSIMGPTRCRGTFKSHFFAFVITTFVIGLAFLIMYLASHYGNVNIPGPSGGQLFH